MDNNSNYKVHFVYSSLEGATETESMWAEKIGDYYKILNVAFFAPNIAYGDIVKVEDDGGVLYFDELIEESGHSTIQMIIFDKDHQSMIENEILGFGCDWEGSHRKNYISIDVPSEVSYVRFKEYLMEGQMENRWNFKEACLSQIHRS
ncbi:hypothetical protein A4H97_15430 [Niastella yeongjuensis]|uniref:DUF4265 domain-containing protein n=1 Tax=Niastella yeongjuensis TaxID=354355 RepID=A0A1V9E4D8_9BACT|nr:DUF4265 domain-containing protein [Niastella yeongjuensis]OQP40990.1 hypothetical protein A4H97_15430 [Niastella yeongjuensis]SEO95554.1 protein of unknown function [Niastella yeongjuensis]